MEQGLIWNQLLHPKYASYLKMEHRKEIERLVRGIIDLLSSPEVVVDDRHSPKLWSSFLDGLLATPMAKIELSPSAMKGGNALPRRTARRSATHSGSSSLSKRGSPSLSSSPSVEASSPAAQSSSSAYQPSDAHSASSVLGSGMTMSPPVVHSVSSTGDSYSAHYDGPPNATFGFAQGQMQQGFPTEQDTVIAQMHGQHGPYHMHNSLQMNVPEFFQPPPLFDNDLLQSVHSIPDSSIWQNMPCKSFDLSRCASFSDIIPLGFNWMGALQSSDQDSTMQDVLAPGMSYDVNTASTNNNGQF